MHTGTNESVNATLLEEILGAEAKCPAHPAVAYVGMACVYWFTFELLVRFVISPDKCRFVQQPCTYGGVHLFYPPHHYPTLKIRPVTKVYTSWLNIIDLLAVAPSYFELVLAVINVNLSPLGQLLLPLRTLRLLKLARYSSGMRKLAAVIRRARVQLMSVCITTCIAVMVSSTIIYYVEKDVHLWRVAITSPYVQCCAVFWGSRLFTFYKNCHPLCTEHQLHKHPRVDVVVVGDNRNRRLR
jgi:hypothetical protein